MKVKRLNEDYLDSVEYKVSRYEGDVEELMTRLHKGYESGMVNATTYVTVLRKVYDLLSELDYVEEPIVESTGNISARVQSYLENHPYDTSMDAEDICREIADNLFDVDYDDTDSNISHEIYNAVENYLDNLETLYDDDYDDFSAFNNHKDIDRMNTLYNGGKNHRLSEGKTETEKSLEKALIAKGLKINPEYNSIEAAAEYIDMGGKDYSVDQWIEDTLKNYPRHLINETNEDFKRNTNMNIKCDIALDRVAYDVSRILTDIDGERKDKEDQFLIFNCEDAKPVDGTNTEELKLAFRVSGTDHSSKSQSYFEKQKKLTGKMQTNKGMINVSIDGGPSKSFNNVRSIAAFIAVQFGILIRQ